MEFIIFYLLIINAISFSMMGLDKHYAIKDMRRIPERHLFLIGYIGGAIGLLLGLKKFRHKKLKKKFSYGLPLLSIINISAVAVLLTIFYR
ncbi:DUF1294 domain-containing protein [Alkalihalobacillus deserti]|uniref:DUF1294 domain-containing protein n=1 Tax=Alkalihalobacillus deserti TaxID=2879466 RepID=UPI001D138306|nr:DUF1294 domain-containing protein [Alkalihalobacillus deserti]